MSDGARPAEQEAPPAGEGTHPPSSGFALFLACAAMVAVFLLGVVRARPLPLPSLKAPPAEFQGLLAARDLFELLRVGDEGPAPHPVGSAENRRVRDWIVERLRREGITAEVEREWIVLPSARRCAWVENVVARVAGTGGEGGARAVLAVAHYDSVPAGPGAGDDLSGVVVLLETARALRAGPAPSRDVVLLFTDGEEAGLLGARAFVRRHGTDGIAAVVNVEARGTSGPSLMFETGPGSARTVSAWSALATRPLTSSLFASVYKTMPNDTDFTVFAREGVPGLNFAFVGGVEHYHTPLDTPGRVDARSLQHHGDNVLAALRGLAAAGALPEDGEAGSDRGRAGSRSQGLPPGEGLPDEAGASREEIVWFDVLGFFVVRLREVGAQLLALFAAAAAVLVAAGHVAMRRASILGVLGAVLVAGVTIVASLAAAWGLGELLRLTGALRAPLLAEQTGPIAAAAGAAVLVAGGAAVLAGRWISPLALSAGTWLAFAAGGVTAAFLLPGGSYLLAVPAFVAKGVALVRRRTPGPAADFAGLLVAAVLLLPLVPPIADAMGVAPLLWIATPFALTATALVPLVAAGGARRWWVAAGGAALVVVGAVAASLAEPWTPERPRAVNITWARNLADRHAHWFVASASGLPGQFREVGAFDDETERIVPWETDRGWATEAPSLDLPGPALEGLTVQLADGGRRLRFRLVSPRGAPVTSLVIVPTARLRRATIGGAPVPPESLRDEAGSFAITCLTTPPEGIEIDLEFADEKPVDAYVADRSWGLPPGADAILRARPADAVPQGRGDMTVVYRKLSL